MDTPEHLAIDVYPWAQPTPEQRRMFDALSAADKRQMILAAIEAGFASGVSEKTIDEIIAEARSEDRHAS